MSKSHNVGRLVHFSVTSICLHNIKNPDLSGFTDTAYVGTFMS